MGLEEKPAVRFVAEAPSGGVGGEPSPPDPGSLWRRLVAVLAAPTDPTGLAAFRFLYGALVALGSARFLDSGWPE